MELLDDFNGIVGRDWRFWVVELAVLPGEIGGFGEGGGRRKGRKTGFGGHGMDGKGKKKGHGGPGLEGEEERKEEGAGEESLGGWWGDAFFLLSLQRKWGRMQGDGKGGEAQRRSAVHGGRRSAVHGGVGKVDGIKGRMDGINR